MDSVVQSITLETTNAVPTGNPNTDPADGTLLLANRSTSYTKARFVMQADGGTTPGATVQGYQYIASLDMWTKVGGEETISPGEPYEVDLFCGAALGDDRCAFHLHVSAITGDPDSVTFPVWSA